MGVDVTAPDPAAAVARRQGLAFLLAMLDGGTGDGAERIREMIQETGTAAGWVGLLDMLTGAVRVGADAIGATHDSAELGPPMNAVAGQLIEAVRVAATALAELEVRVPGAMYGALDAEASRLLYESA